MNRHLDYYMANGPTFELYKLQYFFMKFSGSMPNDIKNRVCKISWKSLEN